jgi:hypothetical protein
MCKHFRFEAGSAGYSELTPGTDWDSGCAKGKWALSGYHVTERDWRRTLAMAETCEQFDEAAE